MCIQSQYAMKYAPCSSTSSNICCNPFSFTILICPSLFQSLSNILNVLNAFEFTQSDFHHITNGNPIISYGSHSCRSNIAPQTMLDLGMRTVRQSIHLENSAYFSLIFSFYECNPVWKLNLNFDRPPLLSGGRSHWENLLSRNSCALVNA